MKRPLLVALLAVAAFYAYAGYKTLAPLAKAGEASAQAVTTSLQMLPK